MMKRSLLAVALTMSALLGTHHAFAGTRLAVGAVAPLPQSPLGEFRPVYVTPVKHSRWEPSSDGFREPIYTTPRGYIYHHVRGYQLVRTKLASVVVKKRMKATRIAGKGKAKSGLKKRRAPCVTDIGYGRYELCN
jgi:hypothetical protein